MQSHINPTNKMASIYGHTNSSGKRFKCNSLEGGEIHCASIKTDYEATFDSMVTFQSLQSGSVQADHIYGGDLNLSAGILAGGNIVTSNGEFNGLAVSVTGPILATGVNSIIATDSYVHAQGGVRIGSGTGRIDENANFQGGFIECTGISVDGTNISLDGNNGILSTKGLTLLNSDFNIQDVDGNNVCHITNAGEITATYLNIGTGPLTSGSIHVGTGSISGGSITGTSLHLGTGTISSGAITSSGSVSGTSVVAGTGVITSGNITSSGTVSGTSLTGTSLNVGTGIVTCGVLTCTGITDSGTETDHGLVVKNGSEVVVGGISLSGAITGTSLNVGTGDVVLLLIHEHVVYVI